MLWRITVAKSTGFSPRQQQTQSGDAVFWLNDDSEPHQPVPTDAGALWSVPEIPPGGSSDQVNVDVAGTVNYKCGIAGHDETGSIMVANAVPIAFGAQPIFGGALSINTGQSVSWANSDAEPHQPCPNTGDPWFAEPINSGDISACIAFPTAGTFEYHCKLHPSETGTITVANPS